MAELKQESSEPENENGGKDEKKVVLKVEMHCGGCASKIPKIVKGFQGVECVKTEWEANRLTVFGKMDPVKIRDKLAYKTKKKVDLISPLPSKQKPQEKKPQEKKPKEPPVTTAVLKLSLHCEGCIDKIHKILVKTDGIHEKYIDKEKEVVRVKGTMDVKALVESLKKNLKRPVEIVPPKKEKEDKKDMLAPAFLYIPLDAYGRPQAEYQNFCPFLHNDIFSEENANACSVM